MLPKVGDTASLSKTISQDDVNRFAELTGDDNPVHVDETAARKTRFGRRIAHGMWGVSLVSAVMGTKLPGPGTIYLNQTIKFSAPVYPGDTVTATVTVKNVREDKKIVTLDTVCENQNQDLIMSGEAVVLFEEISG